jgi:LysR family transcriptional regulator, glycine cleavage system transcriptional activator
MEAGVDVPMNALRAFEVAARAGSFVQAGVELGVTAAAVSQQVKALEGRLSRQLFVRQGNRITLTDAGRALFFRVEGPFADLAAAMAEAGARPVRARLVVSVLPMLADWLVARLAGFSGLEIRVEEDPVVLARDGVDLRVTYGAHLYPDHRVEVLFRDVLVAVAAPGAEGAARVHCDWGPAYGAQPGWAAWSGGRADPAEGWRVGSVAVALALARGGLGVALVPRRVAAADVAAGRLIVLAGPELPLGRDFVMVMSQAVRRRPALQALVARLAEEGHAGGAALPG